MRKTQLAIVPLVLTLVSLACGTGGNTAKESTLQAISAQVRETGTAAAAQDQQVTQAVDQSSDSAAATSAASAPILAELPKYGVDPSEGKLGWIHQPVTLEVAGYRQYKYINNYLGTLAQDFVISADITWNVVGSTAGCGFVLRSDGNEDALNQYVAIITRVASGHFLFSTMSKGKIVTGKDIYAYSHDKNFQWLNDTTNRLTIVGRGNHFWVYTNGTLIGEVDPSAPPVKPILPPEVEKPANSDPQSMELYRQKQAEREIIVAQMEADYAAQRRTFNSSQTVFERGFTAMVALSESGRSTRCQFNNAWLFLIDSPAK